MDYFGKIKSIIFILLCGYSMNIPNFDSAKIAEILTGPHRCIYHV